MHSEIALISAIGGTHLARGPRIGNGCSAVRLAHLLWEQGVVGSNPATPTKKPPEKDFLRRGSKKREISYGEKYCSGCSAVRLARQLRELEVAGSNPVSPTKIKTFALKGKGFLLWAYDGYSSPKVRVQEKRIPLYQAGSLIFVHPIRQTRPEAKQSDAIQFSRPREGIRKHSFFHFRTATCHTANEQR